MRRAILIAFVAATLCSGIDSSFALPLAGLQGDESVDAGAQADEARLFCYNRNTGRFLHWGRCAAVRRVRVYCRNRYTGRFIHWGAC